MDKCDISRPGKRKMVTTLVEELGYQEQRLKLEIAEGTDEVITTFMEFLELIKQISIQVTDLEKIEAAIKRKSRKIEGRMNASKEFFFEKKKQGDWVMIGDDSPVKNEDVVKMVIIPITLTLPLLEPQSSNASAIIDCEKGKLGFVNVHYHVYVKHTRA